MLVFFALGNAKVLSFALGEAKVPNANGFASQWNIGLILHPVNLIIYNWFDVVISFDACPFPVWFVIY